MDRKSFVLYSSSKEIIDELNLEQTGVLFKSIFEYITDGEPLEMDLATKIVFKTIRSYLDKDFEAYKIKCDNNRANGSKGGRPKGVKNKSKQTEENRSVFSETEKKGTVNLKTQKNIDTDFVSDFESDIESVSENITDTSRVKSKSKTKSKKFEPPTVDEVRIYIDEMGYQVDAEQFVNYYDARGWELSRGRKVKDWKACVRTWNGNSKNWQTSREQKSGVVISGKDSEQRSEYASFDDYFGA